MFMTLSEELQARGFIYQFSADTIGEILDGEPRTLYHGIDPSADSAHVGNLVVWLLLRHLAKAGHRVIFLVGGGTGMIGDPKPDAERELRPEVETDYNVACIRAQAERLIADGGAITFVNNKDWLASETLISFLRDIGKHFTVNELIKKDAIAKRLSGDTGISYTEFAYPLLQGYDYYVLYNRFGCTLQVGGSDQWGNIVAGVELIRRKAGATAHALTVPLVTDKATGKKFGKSEGNAVWLDAQKTSPYAFYQFWLNVSDESVIDYLKLFTFISLDEISEIAAEHEKDKSARTAQRALALGITSFVHGETTATAVAAVSAVLFGEESIDTLDAEGKKILLNNAPTHQVTANTPLIDVLVASGLASSKREARQFITDGAITLAGEKLTEENTNITVPNTPTLLRRGKKQLVVLYS